MKIQLHMYGNGMRHADPLNEVKNAHQFSCVRILGIATVDLHVESKLLTTAPNRWTPGDSIGKKSPIS